jgi:hypothetical protein
MGTLKTRYSAPTGTNKDREGFTESKTWDEATDTWDDVTDTWDTYGGEIRRSESGTNMTRH